MLVAARCSYLCCRFILLQTLGDYH